MNEHDVLRPLLRGSKLFSRFYGRERRKIRGPIRWELNGGASFTDITPTGMVEAPNRISSVCATDDPNFMAVIDLNGKLWTSSDGGANWTLRNTDVTLHSLTIGQWPGLLNGQRALYFGGTTKLGKSLDGGVTIVDSTGDWGSAVGAAGPFLHVIPVTVA